MHNYKNTFIIKKIDNNSKELDKFIINNESIDFIKDILKDYLSTINDSFNDEDGIFYDTENKVYYMYPEIHDFYFKIIES